MYVVLEERLDPSETLEGLTHFMGIYTPMLSYSLYVLNTDSKFFIMHVLSLHAG